MGEPKPRSRAIQGFHYHLSDEQLRAFASRAPAERLRWLDEARELTARLASPSAKRWWQRFREGT